MKEVTSPSLPRKSGAILKTLSGRGSRRFPLPIVPRAPRAPRAPVSALVFFLSLVFTNRSLCGGERGAIQVYAFCDSTKGSTRRYKRTYLLFCQYFDHFKPFPVSKSVYLLYLVFCRVLYRPIVRSLII